MTVGLEKSGVQGKTILRRYSYSGFTATAGKAGLLEGVRSLHCDCRDGVLRRGVGVLPLYKNGVAVSVKGEQPLFLFEAEGFLNGRMQPWYYALLSDGYLYLLASESGVLTKKVQMGTKASVASIKTEGNRVCNLFVGPLGGYCSENGNSFTRVLASGDAVCAAGGRFFVAVGNGVIAYSAAYDENNWSGAFDEGGALYLPSGYGGLRALVSAEGYVYALLERGIFRLQAAASSEEMLLERVDYAGGKICENAAVATGAGVIFLAENGAYRLQGRSAKAVCSHLNLQPIADDACEVGICDDLALIEYSALNVTGAKVKKRVAIYADGEEGFFVDTFERLSGKDVVCYAGRGYRFVKNASNAQYTVTPYFETPALDFGRSGRKTLKKIRLRGEGKVDVVVLVGDKERKYSLSFEKGFLEKTVREKGNAFAFRFELGRGSRLTGFSVEYLRAKEDV